MNWVGQFFVENFILICVSIVMYVIAIQRFKQHTKISLYTICIITSALLLAVSVHLQLYAKATGNITLAVICSIFGYSLRPMCIHFLILMSEHFIPKKYLWLTFLPLVLNFIVYLCAFIPGTKEIIFGFNINEKGTLDFVAGPLRFTSHIVSLLYLLFLLFVAFVNLRAKHLTHSIAILVCSTFVVLAVIIESFFNPNDDIRILNVTIAVSTIIYYLYLYMEKSSIDTLTGLFNRETYYRDTLKMQDSASGVVQYDMNGLKYINDNFGHLEGDKALSTIAETIMKSVKRSMYAYRLGGDEFIVIVNSGTKEDIERVVAKFKENLSKTPYHCSIGYAYRNDKSVSFDELLKEAERKMYQDKEEFYKNSKFERRKADRV